MLSYRWLCGKPYHIIYDTTPYTILYHTIPYHTIPYHTISYHIIYYIIYHTISHHISHHHLISYHIISYSTCSVASHDISHTIVREMPQLIPSSTPDISRFFFRVLTRVTPHLVLVGETCCVILMIRLHFIILLYRYT